MLAPAVSKLVPRRTNGIVPVCRLSGLRPTKSGHFSLAPKARRTQQWSSLKAVRREEHPLTQPCPSVQIFN